MASRLQIVVYPTQAQYEEIQRKAEKLGISMSSYLIMVGVHSQIKIETKEP